MDFNISKRIIELRKKQNISQYKLSKLSGISQAGLSDIELNKKQPTIPTLEKIIKALDISWIEFFAEDAPDMPPEIRRLMDQAKTLSPEQVEKLTEFIKTIKGE